MACRAAPECRDTRPVAISPGPGSKPTPPTHSHPPADRLRALFLSDLHLGALGARADLVLQFLLAHPADTYLLVGDILDLWQPLLPHWTARDQAVIDHLRARQAAGAAIIYLRGNHDPQPGLAPASRRVPAEARHDYLHRAADGRLYLVLHGDQVDSRWIRAHALTRLGSRIDHGLRRLDAGLHRLRGRTRGEARSTLEAVLARINALIYRRRSHERRLVALARARGADGVICGHFHIAGLNDDHGLIYANCGDWVDSFTALAETADGSLRLICSSEIRLPVAAQARADLARAALLAEAMPLPKALSGAVVPGAMATGAMVVGAAGQ